MTHRRLARRLGVALLGAALVALVGTARLNAQPPGDGAATNSAATPVDGAAASDAAAAATPAADATAMAEVSPAAVADVARELNCPLCQGYNLQDCPLPVCAQMRDLIRGDLAAGKTKTQIKARFVEDYGPQVLNEPPREGFFLAAWIMPVVALAFGFVIVVLFARRVAARQATAPTASRRAPTPTAASAPHDMSADVSSGAPGEHPDAASGDAQDDAPDLDPDIDPQYAKRLEALLEAEEQDGRE